MLASPAWAAAPSSVGLLQVHTEGMSTAAYPLITHLNVRGTIAHAFQKALRRGEPTLGFVDYTDLGLQAWEPSEASLQPQLEPSQLVMKPWQGLPPGVETPWVTWVRVVMWRSFRVNEPISLHVVLLFSTWTRQGEPVLSEVLWGASQGAQGAQAGRMFTVFPLFGVGPGGFALPLAVPKDSAQAAQQLLEELILLHLRKALEVEPRGPAPREGLPVEGPAPCWEVERGADWEGRWLHTRPGEEAALLSQAHPQACTRAQVRCAIASYWIRSAEGPSLRYHPGVDDLDARLNVDGSARLRWSAFADHAHGYLYCAWPRAAPPP